MFTVLWILLRGREGTHPTEPCSKTKIKVVQTLETVHDKLYVFVGDLSVDQFLYTDTALIRVLLYDDNDKSDSGSVCLLVRSLIKESAQNIMNNVNKELQTVVQNKHKIL
jgi:hypothetical protein